MKITKTKLKQIIKEELESLLEEPETIEELSDEELKAVHMAALKKGANIPSDLAGQVSMNRKRIDHLLELIKRLMYKK